MYANSHQFLFNLFSAALAAVRAEERVPHFLPLPPKGRTIVVGAGKAAASMAGAVETHYKGSIDAGLVVTRYQHGLPLKKIEVVEAGHPMPDQAGQAAAQRILDLAATAQADDLLLCLISGGGSALLSLPAPGLSMADIQMVTKGLLISGANIHEMNCVRKHISAIAGGRLARAAKGARIVTLLISDVPGDDISVIASGPTVADPTTFDDARAILAKYMIPLPPAVESCLAQAIDESVKPGDPCLAHAENFMIAKPQDALEAAASYAKAQGVTPLILGNAIEGEARDVALIMAGIARQVMAYGQPIATPCVLLSGGETTVTVKGNGRGGRNAEFLLNFSAAMQGEPRVAAIACDTDGIDGTEDNAGAIMLPTTLSQAAEQGLNIKSFIAANDSYSFFAKTGGLIMTGPTRTNVNDFRAILIS